MAAEQLKAYLSFFNTKRDLITAEIASVFNDVQETRLLDDMYSKEEVLSAFDALLVDVKDTVRREHEKSIKMSAVVVEQLINLGAASGVELSVDMSKAEDEGAIARLGTTPSGALSPEADLKRKAAVKLDSIRDEHARIVEEAQRLKEENATLRERYQQMQTRATSAVKEVSDLNQEITRLERELAAASSTPSTSVVSGSSERIAGLEAEVKRLEDQLATSEAARKEADAAAAKEPLSPEGVPVTKTKQFIQMKQMLSKKNAQLIELRTRLAKYEPDDADVIDDDEVPHGK